MTDKLDELLDSPRPPGVVKTVLLVAVGLVHLLIFRELIVEVDRFNSRFGMVDYRLFGFLIMPTVVLFWLIEERIAYRNRSSWLATLAVFGLAGAALAELLSRREPAEVRGFAVEQPQFVLSKEARMMLQIRFFAAARDAAGDGEASLELPTGTTVADAFSALGVTYPALAPLLPRSRAAVNQSYVDAGYVLADGDELAIIPPVSGG